MKRLQLNQSNRPIEWLSYLEQSRDLELSPPYQRGDVWGIRRRRNFIRSILMGIPIPSIIVNDRLMADFVGDKPEAFAVIDGKQRCTAILMFFADRFTVPAEWFEPAHIATDRPEIIYSELNAIGQRMFRGRGLAFSEARLKTLEDEQEVFELVNFGGIPQGERDDDLIPVDSVEPFNLADLKIWIEDRPCRTKGTMRVCWVSRKQLRCEVYSKYTSRTCENALDRLWPEFCVSKEK